MAFDDAVDTFARLFLEAVNKRFRPNERVGLGLSGGLDSRAILAAAIKLFPQSKGYAYTFGTPGCDDIEIARKVIARTHWQHDVLHFNNDNWFFSRFDKVLDTDGMKDMHACAR